jgi:hypothetical protein
VPAAPSSPDRVQPRSVSTAVMRRKSLVAMRYIPIRSASRGIWPGVTLARPAIGGDRILPGVNLAPGLLLRGFPIQRDMRDICPANVPRRGPRSGTDGTTCCKHVPDVPPVRRLVGQLAIWQNVPVAKPAGGSLRLSFMEAR